MKYKIAPLPLNKWHKHDHKDFAGRPKVIYPLVDTKRLRYVTGLTKKDIEYLKKRGLTVDLDDTYNPMEEHPFWDSVQASIVLDNKTIILDEDDPFDYIKIRILMNHPAVANSLHDFKKGLFPGATHYFVDSLEDLSRRAKLVELKTKAYTAVAKLSLGDLRDLVMVVGGVDTLSMSENQIKVELDKLIENNPQDVLNYLKLPKEDIDVKVALYKGLHKGVLVKDIHNRIKFMDMVLGNSDMDAIMFLKDEKNKEIFARILEMINK